MKNLLLAISFLLCIAPAWAELEVVALKHRSVEEILPVILPLLGKDEAASGMNYQLVLRASPHTLAQIKKMLASLDVAPRRLKISVMQDVDNETVERLTELSASVSGLSLHGVDGRDAETARSHLKAKVISTRTMDYERNTQQLQVLEGHRALVRSGQSVPVAQRQVIHDQWGSRVIDSTQYQQADSGFYVLPRVNGNRVTLEISTQNDTFESGVHPATRVRQVSSIVDGRLGEWIALGGTAQLDNNDRSGIAMRGSARARDRHNVLIKVEELE